MVQHPVHGRRVDVVALPLRNWSGTELYPYDITGAAPALKVGPAEGVSVLGFPFGLAGGGAFAIWTRGFVASEPDVDYADLPAFLVDARTRPGQSGSPVIAYSSGGATALADGSTAFIDGPLTNLLGVSSFFDHIHNTSSVGVLRRPIEPAIRLRERQPPSLSASA